jgi:TRAP-type C4-dicarboxylate transport system permease small subunit
VIERLDGAIYRVERALVAVFLLVMGVFVFLDVVHRVSTREGSWMHSPLAVGVVASVVAALAFRTRDAEGWPWKGVATGAAIVVAQLAFVKLLPNGLVWSQTLALALTLWLGTMGASLAAHERRHLAMDVGAKIWPPALLPKITALGHLVTGLFCLMLFWLGTRSVVANWDLWSGSGHAAGNLSGLAIPKWVPSLAIPYGMGVLAFRFLLDTWRAWTGRLAVGGDDTLHQLGIDTEGG